MARRRRLPPTFWVGTVVLTSLVVVLTIMVVTDGADAPASTEATTTVAAPTTSRVDVVAGELLRTDLIHAAIAAVVAERGDDVAFFEVNATPDLVNVFVRGYDVDGAMTAIAYVYDDDGLGEPAAPTSASGPTFTADQVDFDADAVLDDVVTQLPSALARAFSILGAQAADGGVDGPAAAAEYRITMESAAGGSLSVLVTGDGQILGSIAG